MFLRFERIKRPQSYNDSPITSLSWMVNERRQTTSPSSTSEQDQNHDHHHQNIHRHHLQHHNGVPRHQHDPINHYGDHGPGGGVLNNEDGGVIANGDPLELDPIPPPPLPPPSNHRHPHPYDPIRDINNNNGFESLAVSNNNNNGNRNNRRSQLSLNSLTASNSNSAISTESNERRNETRHICNSGKDNGYDDDDTYDKEEDEQEILDGWLAVGNCRGVVGVTYTTIDMNYHLKNQTATAIKQNCQMYEDHKIYFDENQNTLLDSSHKCNRKTYGGSYPQRTNFNLRGHRSEIIFVRWNEPFHKLATCDRNGVIFVWIQYEGRWSIELINDRSTRVTDFAWSHDGRMALICYTDGFVLVGSVSGQRYWSSMLNLNECSITCGTWTPNNQNVLFGTSNGHILVISVHGVFVTQISVQEGVEISGMLWSCKKFQVQPENHNNSRIVNSPEPNNGDHILAVSFIDGTVYLMRNYDEVIPNVIETSLLNVKMDWSSDGTMLAIGGHHQTKSALSSVISRNVGYGVTGITGGNFLYTNVIRFYLTNGQLIRQVSLDFNALPLSSLAWACNDQRLFVACGQILYVAWIIQGIPSLSFYSGLQVYNGLKMESEIDRVQIAKPVKNLLYELFTSTIHCYLSDYRDIRQFVFRPPANKTRLYCTLIRQEDPLNPNNTTYTLYLEYMGGLVPILKGKKSSKLKPEFVIFDPQRPSQIISSFNENDKKIKCFSSNNGDLNGSGRWMNGYRHQLSQTSDSENDDSDRSTSNSSSLMALGSPYLTPKTRRRLRTRAAQFNRFNRNQNPNNLNMLMMEQQQQPSSSSIRHHYQSPMKNSSFWLDELPDENRIVLITSNIWGTKFKFLGVTPMLPTHLGSVTYRTSLLHLQPRQMSLVIKELDDKNTMPNDQMQNSDDFSQLISDHLVDSNNDSSAYGYGFSSDDSEDEESFGVLRHNHQLLDSDMVPIIAPMCKFKSVRNSMLLNQAVPPQIEPNPAPSPPTPRENLDQQLIRENREQLNRENREQSEPSGRDNSLSIQAQINQECHSIVSCMSNFMADEFLTLQINQNDSDSSTSYNLEIKPSSSSFNNSNQNLDHQHNHPIVIDLEKESSTSRSVQHQTLMVRQFKHQTFQSESPKHVSSHCSRQQSNPTQSSSSSPNKQSSVIRQKIMLKESPRKSSVSNCLTENLQKKPGYCMNGTVCDIVETAGSGNDCDSSGLFKFKTSSTSANDPLAMASMVGCGDDGQDEWIPSELHHLPNFSTVGLLNRQYIDETESIISNSQSLSSVATPIQTPSHVISTSKTSKLGSPSHKMNVGTSKDHYKMELNDESNKSCLRNVEQAMQSISRKLSNPIARRNSLMSNNNLDQKEERKTCNLSNPTLFRSNSLKCRYESDKSERMVPLEVPPNNQYSNRIVYMGCDQRNNLSINSLNDDDETHELRHNHINQITQKENKSSYFAHDNRSLPASPNRSRKLLGRHFQFTSPKVVRRIRRGLNYLDCSSEDENNSSDEEDVEKWLRELNLKNQKQRQNATNVDSFPTRPSAMANSELLKNHYNKGNINNRTDQNYYQQKQQQKICKTRRRYSSSKYDEDKDSKRFKLQNKAPLWNEVSQVYQLDFGGRVTQESAKNFQIEHQGRQVMQFGRIDTNSYTLDFEYPFSAVQAMAVALANVTQRLK